MAQERKNTLRNVMNLAWSFVKKNGYTMSEALRVAWMNIKNKANMSKGIAHFYFRKVDGSIREAFGTIKSDLVPATKGKGNTSPLVQVFFDTVKAEWRCYKVASLLKIA